MLSAEEVRLPEVQQAHIQYFVFMYVMQGKHSGLLSPVYDTGS